MNYEQFNLNITKVSNGFIVNAFGDAFVAATIDDALDIIKVKLSDYIEQLAKDAEAAKEMIQNGLPEGQENNAPIRWGEFRRAETPRQPATARAYGRNDPMPPVNGYGELGVPETNAPGAQRLANY
jgi:hypothetical protein